MTMFWDNWLYILLSLAAIFLFVFYITVCILSHWYELKQPKRKKTDYEIMVEREERDYQKLRERAFKRALKY